MQVRIYGGIVSSRVDGPGQRSVVHFAGCSIRCPGCFNLALWSGRGTKARSMETTLVAAAAISVSPRVTISGGEPTDQPAALIELLRELRRLGATDVVMFTGRRWSDLEAWREFAPIEAEGLVDTIIDGHFDHTIPERDQVMRGSSNQRVIQLTGRLKAADFHQRDVQVHLDIDGRAIVTGFPTAELLREIR